LHERLRDIIVSAAHGQRHKHTRNEKQTECRQIQQWLPQHDGQRDEDHGEYDEEDAQHALFEALGRSKDNPRKLSGAGSKVNEA